MFFPLGPQYFVSVTIPVASSLGPTDVPHDVLVVQFKCCEYGVKVVYTGESTKKNPLVCYLSIFLLPSHFAGSQLSVVEKCIYSKCIHRLRLFFSAQLYIKIIHQTPRADGFK